MEDDKNFKNRNTRTKKHRKQQKQSIQDSAPDYMKMILSSVGNSNIQQLMDGGFIQAKLNSGAGGDFFEQQADKIADEVVNGKAGSDIQAKNNLVQRKISSGVSVPAEFGINNLKGKGTALSTPLREFFEPRLGVDLGNVRIHTGDTANKLAETVNARALTHKGDIVFKDGHYQPGTTEGRKLLAHELVHTVQQGASYQKSGDSVLQLKADPLQTNTDDVYFVTDPSNYAGTLISYLPIGTELVIIDKGALKSFNKNLTDKSLEWWKIKVNVCSDSNQVGKTGWVMKKFLRGENNNIVYYQGEEIGEIDNSYINCLGHASGTESEVQFISIKTQNMQKLLLGLGFNCQVGNHTVLTSHITSGEEVMMVYLYMYKPSWRDPADQVLSFAQLATKYKWDGNTWKQDEDVLYDSTTGVGLPLDFHALRYNHGTSKWEWVGHRKAKTSGTYSLDSTSTSSAVTNPDNYFSNPDQVLVSIACWK